MEEVNEYLNEAIEEFGWNKPGAKLRLLATFISSQGLVEEFVDFLQVAEEHLEPSELKADE